MPSERRAPALRSGVGGVALVRVVLLALAHDRHGVDEVLVRLIVGDDQENARARAVGSAGRAGLRSGVRRPDQHFPDWTATVDGAPAPILRANFLFRAVEVPAGESTVEFRYAPLSPRVGAGISLLTLLGVLTGLVVSTRHRGHGQG